MEYHSHFINVVEYVHKYLLPTSAGTQELYVTLNCSKERVGGL